MVRQLKEHWNRLPDEQIEKFLSDAEEGANHPSRKKVIELLSGWKSVLDVGCGPGIAFEMVQQAYPLMEYVGVGIDVTDKFIVYCRRRFPERQDCFRTLSIFELDKISRTFDVVMCRHLLEHLPDYREALAQMYAKAERKLLVVFYLPPKPLRWGRNKIDMRYESPLFYTHVYDLGRFLNFLKCLTPAPREIRIYPHQGFSARGNAWSDVENEVYEIVKPDG